MIGHEFRLARQASGVECARAQSGSEQITEPAGGELGGGGQELAHLIAEDRAIAIRLIGVKPFGAVLHAR
ncbi:hypothetical protein [Nocardia spumae]|uniref:hypothetical protein n=1 Tax=Nocardia spumae TaxID=2887190 RepID=UPI001D14680A|nr:hypothetical protein [Nocardia spumae]